MPKTPKYVFLFDLKRTVLERSGLRALNPDYEDGRPCVHAGICSGQRPEQRWAEGDFSESNSRIVRRYAKRIRNGHVSRHTRLEGAVSQRLELIEELRDRGWFVSNPPPKPRYRVYVLELDPDLKQVAGVRAQNPDGDPTKPCVYVGQTSKDVETRMREHQDGTLSGKYVEGNVRGLLPELTEGPEGLTLLESLRAERQLGWRLRREGYFVLGGH